MGNLRSHNWILNTILALVVLLVTGALLMLVFGIPYVVASANNSEAVREGTDLQNCRAFYNTRVQDATLATSKAQTELFIDKANLDIATNQALRAATVEHDPLVLRDTLNQSLLLTAAVNLAETDLRQKQQLYSDQLDAYKTKLRLSQADSKSFTKQCIQDQFHEDGK